MSRTQGFFSDASNTAKSAGMFMSFCAALNRYCAEIGVAPRHTVPAKILHDAACNTISRMHRVTATDVRHMTRIERDIPHLYNDIVAYLVRSDYMANADRMRDMCLADVVRTVREHRR